MVQRVDLRNTHEEEDTIIIHQIIKADENNVPIVADDTDIFVLLCHFVHNKPISGLVKMVSTQERPKSDQHQPHSNGTFGCYGQPTCSSFFEWL